MGPPLPGGTSDFRVSRSGAYAGDRRLFDSIERVAAAVSSKSDLTELLLALVDQAKAIGQTDKAVLCLVESRHGKRRVDERGMVVRGSRSEYPESWWLAQVKAVAPQVLDSGRPNQRFDRSQGAWFLCLPIKAKDQSVGVLVAINSAGHRFSKEQVASLKVVCAFASVVVENARLAAEAQHCLVAEERRRIAKEMHDGLAQRLFSASLGMEFCKKRLNGESDEVSTRLSEAQRTVQEGLGELRQYIFDLRPQALDRLGLAGAIRKHMEELLRPERVHHELRVAGGARPLAPTTETCVYRVAQELVANAAKHSQSDVVKVMLTFETDRVRLQVKDQGVGFDVRAAGDRAEKEQRLGLKGISERIEAVGGNLQVVSSPGRGTTVRVSVPG